MLRRSSGPHLAIQDAGELVRIEVENLESVGNVRESLETWGRGGMDRCEGQSGLQWVQDVILVQKIVGKCVQEYQWPLRQ